MTVAIRHARKSDIDAMIPMLGELFSIETDFAVDAEKQRTGLLQLLSGRDKSIIFVAQSEEGDMIGMVTAQLVVSTAAGGYGALLEDMIVREKYRRRGVGGALLSAVGNWAAEKGAVRIQLLADRRNRAALLFYAACGFGESSMCGLYLALKN